jgi:probable rRNA maturation factor
MKNLSVFNHTRRKLRKRSIHSIVCHLTKILELKVKDLEINFVDEKLIKDINIRYLKHDYSTDIITFNYSQDNSILEGEIFISLDDAQKNAKKFNVPLENEITRLLIHGVLHLIGYDDRETNDKRVMKRKENKLVKIIWNDQLKGTIIYDS